MWTRAVAAIARAPAPLTRGEIIAQLQPEFSDLSPVWLSQCLKRAKQAGVLARRDGGYAVAHAPRA